MFHPLGPSEPLLGFFPEVNLEERFVLLRPKERRANLSSNDRISGFLFFGPPLLGFALLSVELMGEEAPWLSPGL